MEPRTTPRPAAQEAELYVGLAEIIGRGFGMAANEPEAGRRSAPEEGTPAVWQRRRRISIGSTSKATLGLEGAPLEVGPVWAGDLVGLRLHPTGPIELGKVVRCESMATDRVWLGVQRLSACARPLALVSDWVAPETERMLILVPDDDSGGRHDACLMAERAYDERLPLDIWRGDNVYTLHLNRLRQRGRGWALAGFEIRATA